MIVFEWMVVIILKWCQDLCILPLNWWMIFFCSEVSEDEPCWYSVEESSWAWNVGFITGSGCYFSSTETFRVSRPRGGVSPGCTMPCHFFVFLGRAKCVGSFLGHWANVCFLLGSSVQVNGQTRAASRSPQGGHCEILSTFSNTRMCIVSLVNSYFLHESFL